MTCCRAQDSCWSPDKISDLSVWIDQLRHIVLGVEIERLAFAYAEFDISVGNPSECFVAFGSHRIVGPCKSLIEFEDHWCMVAPIYVVV